MNACNTRMQKDYNDNTEDYGPRNNFESVKKYLKEDKSDITFAFGRFNPPTIGLEKLMDAIKNLSQVKLKPGDIEKLGIVEGKMKSDDEELPTVAVEADSETEVAEEKTEEVAVEEAKEEEKVEVKEEKTPDQAELTEAEADSEASEEEKEESS